MSGGAPYLQHGDQDAEVGDEDDGVHEVEGVGVLPELVFVAATRTGMHDVRRCDVMCVRVCVCVIEVET